MRAEGLEEEKKGGGSTKRKRGEGRRRRRINEQTNTLPPKHTKNIKHSLALHSLYYMYLCHWFLVSKVSKSRGG